MARRADAATEARGGKGPVLKWEQWRWRWPVLTETGKQWRDGRMLQWKQWRDGRMLLERRYVEGRLSSRLQSGSDGDNGRPRHRGKGDGGVDERRRRRCGRSTEGGD